MDPSAQHLTDLYPASVHAAVQALFRAAGAPVRSQHEPIPGRFLDGRVPFRPGDIDGGVHPVLGLATHFRANDEGARGYTANGVRGDHISIPCFSEHGQPFVLEISFHKGDTYVERVDYPEAPPGIATALDDLLQECETR